MTAPLATWRTVFVERGTVEPKLGEIAGPLILPRGTRVELAGFTTPNERRDGLVTGVTLRYLYAPEPWIQIEVILTEPMGEPRAADPAELDGMTAIIPPPGANGDQATGGPG